MDIDNVVTVVGKTFATSFFDIPGIVTGAAYASGDAFGAKLVLPVPKAGTINTVLMQDLDWEGIIAKTPHLELVK